LAGIEGKGVEVSDQLVRFACVYRSVAVLVEDWHNRERRAACFAEEEDAHHEASYADATIAARR
jgi:hypothetical protein